MKNRNTLLACALLGVGLAPLHPARCESDIVCGARFYIRPSQSRGAASSQRSRYHLFRVDAATGRRRQITRGEHDDVAPKWSPDGQSIVFARDGRYVCVVRPDGSGLRQVWDASHFATDGLEWSPDSRELATLDDDNHRVSFVNVRSGQKRTLSGANAFAWSPDGRRLAWAGTDNRLWITDLKTRARSSTPLRAAKLGWAGPQVLVAALEKKSADGGIEGLSTLVTLNTQAHELTRFSIRAQVPDDDETKTSEQNLADWRSNLLPIPRSGGSFTFRWDNSTSSGRDGFYFRGDASSGAMKLLARGQSFAWAPDGKRFCWAPYYELSDYNTPGQRPRLVYTSPLKIRDGKSERTLISGLVLIGGCDWR